MATPLGYDGIMNMMRYLGYSTNCPECRQVAKELKDHPEHLMLPVMIASRLGKAREELALNA